MISAYLISLCLNQLQISFHLWKKNPILTIFQFFIVMKSNWAKQISIGFLYQDTVPCSFAEKFYIFIAERDQENSWGNQGGLLICSEEVNCRFWWGISIKQTDSLAEYFYNVKNRSSIITTKSLWENLSNETKYWCFCCFPDKMWIKMPILRKHSVFVFITEILWQTFDLIIDDPFLML